MTLRPSWSLNRPGRPFVIGVLQPMSLPPSSAPTATGWNDSCRAGFAPAEEWRLVTAHCMIRAKAATLLILVSVGLGASFSYFLLQERILVLEQRILALQQHIRLLSGQVLELPPAVSLGSSESLWRSFSSEESWAPVNQGKDAVVDWSRVAEIVEILAEIQVSATSLNPLAQGFVRVQNVTRRAPVEVFGPIEAAGPHRSVAPGGRPGRRRGPVRDG